jgi:N-acetylneuraminate synthase/N,N'-diacetyllegionaminate synthase
MAPDAPRFQLGQRTLYAGCLPYVVAEIGINHDGDLQQAKRAIAAAATAGADAVKFQTFHADEFMADRNLQYQYESAGSTVRESMYEMFKRLELPDDWHHQLQACARNHGVEFLSSAADVPAVDLLVSLGVPAIKLASEDLINLPLLDHVSRQGVPVILSTGMADEAEIDRAVEILESGYNPGLMLLHCVSLYPTPDTEANLMRMEALRRRYDYPVGYSDHTLGNVAAIAATALGAVMIEKHFTTDRTRPGPDHQLSATPDELAALVADVRRVHHQRGDGRIAAQGIQQQAAGQFRRSVVAARPITAGATLEPDVLCLKRPGTGIAPHRLAELIGRKVNRNFQPDEQLVWEAIV